MSSRTISRLGAAVTTAAALAIAPIGVALADPVPTAPGTVEAAPGPTSGLTSGLTMVNGAGRTITLPESAAAVLRDGGAAGSSGNTNGAPAPIAKPPGRVGIDSVIGEDDRVQEADPAGYPWGAIAQIESNQGNCTGFMLSHDVLVTAGHCVYDVSSGQGWVTSYRVIPGREGDWEPYGSCSGGIDDVWTTGDWIGTGSPDHDYGLIKLTCDVGYQTGWFGWWYDTGENLVDEYFYVEGFPGDKPYGTMWWDGDTVTSQTDNRVFYWIDTFGGQSGSPVYHYDSTSPGLCGGWCVTGIHTYGVGSSPHNSGTRFNPTVMDFIYYWIDQP